MICRPRPRHDEEGNWLLPPPVYEGSSLLRVQGPKAMFLATQSSEKALIGLWGSGNTCQVANLPRDKERKKNGFGRAPLLFASSLAPVIPIGEMRRPLFPFHIETQGPILIAFVGPRDLRYSFKFSSETTPQIASRWRLWEFIRFTPHHF